MYERYLNLETSFHFIENQLITKFWKTVKAVIKWTYLFSKAVREFVMRGDLVSHSGAGTNLKPFEIDLAPESKKNLFIYRWTDLFFKTKTEKV